MKTLFSRLGGWYTVALLGVILAALCAHLLYISHLPRGLYTDESSIGLNADLILHTGHDEHGVALPVYFQAFGDWKNPLYIYTTAGMFGLFGTSVLTLRLTSALFFLLFLGILYFLLKDIFKDRWVVLFGVLSVAFTPWFFAMSRISFEVVSQLPVVALAFLCIYRAFEQQREKKTLYVILSGFLLGFSIYTYTTSRLLCFLFAALCLLVYWKRATLKQWILGVIGFAVALIPYMYFTLTSPGAATARLQSISFLFDTTLSTADKLQMYATNFLSYISPTFLLTSGDPNTRHAPGFEGELFITTAVGVVAAIFMVIAYKKQKKLSKFPIFLFWSGVAVVASISITSPSHSLRSVLLGFILVIFSCYGLAWVVEQWGWRRLAWIFIPLAIEIVTYMSVYFVQYPPISSYSFGSDGFPTVFMALESQKPAEIIMAPSGEHPEIHAAFYSRFMSAPTPVTVDSLIAYPNTCYLLLGGDTVSNYGSLPLRFSTQDAYTRGECY